MTASPSAPAAMPSVEDVARALDPEAWDGDGVDTLKHYEVRRAVSRKRAVRVRALFAPILAEKEREIAASIESHDAWAASWNDKLEAAEARALAAEAALLAVAPYVDSIVCYASTIEEHDGNRVAKLVNEAAAAIRAQIAAPGAAKEAP